MHRGALTHCVAQSVSGVDLLPTLLDLAHDDVPPDDDDDPLGVIGRGLLPHLQEKCGHDGVAAEYLAEGALAPIVMLRSGLCKFIYSPADPDQLYHLANDADELRKLACWPASSAA
jgi:choline-sulfatase